MTDNLPMIPAFEGKEIRIVEQNGTVVFPLIDLVNAWGVHKNTLRDIISRNPEKFEGFVTTGAHVTCAAGLQVVNEQGLYLLMGSVNTKRMQDKAAAQAVLRFQRWVPELIQQYRKGTIQSVLPVPEDPVLDSLDRNAKYRKHLIEQYDFDPKEATRITLALVHKDTGIAFESPKPSVISRSDPSGDWCNPTDLGRECGLTGQQVNMWLYNNKLQYPAKDGQETIWRLTAEGEQYGEEYPFELSNRHAEIRIRWHRSVKDAFPGLKKQDPIIVA